MKNTQEINKKSIEYWTRKEFDSLSYRKWNEDIGEFDSLIILPERKLHDSGYRLLTFIAVRKNTPICKLGGCSDVIHIDGIGGHGIWNPKYGIPSKLSPKSWSIDCLRTSGLLRIFSANNLTVGQDLSSFEVYSNENSKR